MLEPSVKPSKPLLDLTQIVCAQLHGVGEQVGKLLAKLNIVTVFDLLLHLPLHYEDRTRITALRDLKPGIMGVVEGYINHLEFKPGRKKSLTAYLQDETGLLRLRFFHFNLQQLEDFEKNKARLRCFGEVRWVKNHLEMAHPRYQFLSHEQVPLPTHLTAVYPTTAGLKQGVLQRLMQQALELLKKNPLTDFLSDDLLQRLQLPEINQALITLHQPPAEKNIENKVSLMRNRLAFEELLAQQLQAQTIRHRVINEKTYDLSQGVHQITDFLKILPFDLTAAQHRVLHEIESDLMRDKPSFRLLQGDVGSGKTVIAASAVFAAIKAGFQAALMAPTEILAEQHANNFAHWFKSFSINIVLLKSNLTTKEYNAIINAIKNGEAQLIVGTHAIFQQAVVFHSLALVVIDEQHRFGVHQRLSLREKGKNEQLFPHQLIMTATPIPRTLAMTVYADLDHSVIDQLPPGRQAITTILVSQYRREEVIERVKKHCVQKKQVYWVCPLIEESEELQCQAATKTYEDLTLRLPEISVGLIHGRMKSAEKNTIMQAFKNNGIQLLVATSVIEVGIDVPNASLIIMENAERLGLAQLHQLRGRVGRGKEKSYCVLLYQTPLSALAKKRLNIMRESQNGFVIAEEDLKIRGPGDLLGVQQAGILQFRVADLLRDQALLAQAKITSNVLTASEKSSLLSRWYINKKNYIQA